MIDIKNGIAYSGDVNECGTLVDKINHAISNNINYIQVRAKDIQDMIFVNGKIDSNRVKDFSKLVGSYNGTLSVHLPNPVWDYDNLNIDKSNDLVSIIIKDLLKPLGINDYTIHPHFNRQVYDNLNQDQKQIMLNKMSNYFSQIANLGINLAIENIPVRDMNTINEIEDIDKKNKAEKNISYGMSIDEIQNILDLTKNKVNNGKVGVTYDTGHSLSMIDDFGLKQNEIERWIEHFKDDILIYHITPSLGNDPNKLTEEAKDNNKQLIEWVYECSRKYNVDALSFVEAHTNLNKLSELFDIENEVKSNISYKNNSR